MYVHIYLTLTFTNTYTHILLFLALHLLQVFTLKHDLKEIKTSHILTVIIVKLNLIHVFIVPKNKLK